MFTVSISGNDRPAGRPSFETVWKTLLLSRQSIYENTSFAHFSANCSSAIPFPAYDWYVVNFLFLWVCNKVYSLFHTLWKDVCIKKIWMGTQAKMTIKRQLCRIHLTAAWALFTEFISMVCWEVWHWVLNGDTEFISMEEREEEVWVSKYSEDADISFPIFLEYEKCRKGKYSLHTFQKPNIRLKLTEAPKFIQNLWLVWFNNTVAYKQATMLGKYSVCRGLILVHDCHRSLGYFIRWKL